MPRKPLTPGWWIFPALTVAAVFWLWLLVVVL